MFLLSVVRFDPSTRCDLSIACDDQRGRPLPLYETQNNECDPILHAAHAAPKTQDTKRKAQKTQIDQEKQKQNSNIRNKGLRFGLGINRLLPAKMQMKNVQTKTTKLCLLISCLKSSNFRRLVLKKMPLISA